MRLYVGVTDNDWYRFLSQLAKVDEVNFWQPGGNQVFKAIAPGSRGYRVGPREAVEFVGEGDVKRIF